MSYFVVEPNFPQKKASLVLAKREACVYLQKLSVSVLCPEPDPDLEDEISEHPDILCHHFGENQILCAPSQKKLITDLRDQGFLVTVSNPVFSPYPHDISLDTVRIGKRAFGLQKQTDTKLLQFFRQNGILFTDVKQGYAKCLCCLVTKQAAITEDEGLCQKLTEAGLEVLLISKGDVELSRSHYGFLGGASGKISKNTLAFYGNIHYHRDKSKILSFLQKHGVTPVFLRDAPLKDIGGILCIKEED